MHRTMIRNRKKADLVPWIAAASDSLIGSFASGVTKDIAAVHAALAAVALTPKFVSNPDVNVGVIINSTSLRFRLLALKSRAVK